MKRITLLATLLALCCGLYAQGPDTEFFGITNGNIYWRMDYDHDLSQAELAKALEEKGILTNIDASKPRVITAKIPMHPVRYQGAGLRPEHAEILLTAAQVSGNVTIRMTEGHYYVTVDNLVLQMSRPSTQENISGTHPFEYHFRHQWGIIKNSMFNTFLAAGLNNDFDSIFQVRDFDKNPVDKTSPSAFTPPTPVTYEDGARSSTVRTTVRVSSITTIAGQVVFPEGVTVRDLRSGTILGDGEATDADGFYGQWQTNMYDSEQCISFVCFKPEAFQTQIVSAERNAADSTGALCQRYDAIAGINGSYFNMKELTSVTYLKDEGTVVYADNQAPQADGLVAVKGSNVRIVPTEGIALNDDELPEPDVMVSGPILLQNGKSKPIYVSSEEQERFYMSRHPRSLIGRDERGAIWLITVDGRARGKSEGMSISEVKAMAMNIGLVDALNLDGGGSTTLWVRSAGVINHPCDNHRFDPYGQRVVPNAILVQ